MKEKTIVILEMLIKTLLKYKFSMILKFNLIS